MNSRHPILAGVLAILTWSLAAEVPVEPVRNPFAGDEWKLPSAPTAVKPAAGVEGVKGSCVLCHSLDYISTQPALTRTQWTAAVTKMQAKFGAPIPTNQFPALIEYLTVNYGKGP